MPSTFSRVPLTQPLPADDNCVAHRRCSAVRISTTTIYRLSDVPPVFLLQEQRMLDRLRARVPAWASAGACIGAFFQCNATRCSIGLCKLQVWPLSVKLHVCYYTVRKTDEDPQEHTRNRPMFRLWLNVGHQKPITGIIAFYLYWPKEYPMAVCKYVCGYWSFKDDAHRSKTLRLEGVKWLVARMCMRTKGMSIILSISLC